MIIIIIIMMINIKHGQTGLAYMDEHPGPLFSVVCLQRKYRKNRQRRPSVL